MQTEIQQALETQRQDLLLLEKKRSEIEQEMAIIVDLLDNMPGKPGIKGRLVDDEGFPRDDCDLLEVRK